MPNVLKSAMGAYPCFRIEYGPRSKSACSLMWAMIGLRLGKVKTAKSS
jgi:hypothetical protein